MPPEATPKRVHFLDGDATSGNGPAKKRRSIRGASRVQLPTVVMAMGFAVGTTSDDIRQSLKMTTNATGGFDTSRPIEATGCEIVSVGPRVIARLVFATKADAEKVVDDWNDAEVDGSDLSLWITDDDPVVKLKEEAMSSPFAHTAAQGNNRTSKSATPGPAVNAAFGATGTNGAFVTGVFPGSGFGALPSLAQNSIGSFTGFTNGRLPENKGIFKSRASRTVVGGRSVYERFG